MKNAAQNMIVEKPLRSENKVMNGKEEFLELPMTSRSPSTGVYSGLTLTSICLVSSNCFLAIRDPAVSGK